MAFIKLNKCLNDPKHFLRLIAIIICACIASYQLSECISKILHPPVSTHYEVKLNETLKYPSVTICVNPAYKLDIVRKYNVSHPLFYSQSFKNFDFQKYNLNDFFEEATYSNFAPVYGFDGYMSNISASSFFKLRHGRCFKISAKLPSPKFEFQAGYMILLDHSDLKNETMFRRGFHIHLHEPHDILRDVETQGESYMEYIYVDVFEEVTYTLRTNEYNQLPNKENNCRTEASYSKSACRENCLHERITNEVGCSTPWMKNPRLPSCTSYEQTRKVIMNYNSYSKDSTMCQCPMSCNITIYLPFIQNRKESANLNSMFFMYYTSNLVTVMKEVFGYDWNLFIADLGGSLGFLLGLSVIGVIGVMEQILKMLIKKQQVEEVKNGKYLNSKNTKINDKIEVLGIKNDLSKF